MAGSLGFLIETLVAVLLAVTIVYCVVVSRKLEMLRADQRSLREIVRELTHATSSAEHAIGTLKVTVGQAESALVEQLNSARDLEARLKTAQLEGNDLVSRIGLISRQAAAPKREPEPPKPQIIKVDPMPEPFRTEASRAERPEPVAKPQATVARNRFDFTRLGQQLAEGRGRDAA